MAISIKRGKLHIIVLTALKITLSLTVGRKNNVPKNGSIESKTILCSCGKRF
jgi:hypothetical protein